MFSRKWITNVLVVFLVVASFFLGIFAGKINQRPLPPEDFDFSLFWEAYHTLKDKFVDSDKINNQNVLYGAIAGMANALGDEYTVFFPPSETKKFIEDVKGSFEGVGMEIGVKDEQLQVISPLEETPAQKAGILSGDKILKINDVLTANVSLNEAVDLIRGPKGTEVSLTIYRDEWGSSKEIKVIRDTIDVPSLKLTFIDNNGEENEKGKIALIKLYQFSELAMDDFRTASLEIINKDTERIVLDLRNNPGGYLEVSQYIAGWFLDRGKVVVVENFGENEKEILYKSTGNSALSKYPLVVLINEGSASASEILAGALRDNLGTKLIGVKSFGKGSVQELSKMSEGSSLKVTIAKWLTPNRNSIQGVGLDPDVEVKIEKEDYENNKDPQLIKAIEVVNQLN